MLGDGAGWVKVKGEAAVLLDAADIKPENTISVQVSLMLGFRKYIQIFFFFWSTPQCIVYRPVVVSCHTCK
jgi:hypothetical protein